MFLAHFSLKPAAGDLFTRFSFKLNGNPWYGLGGRQPLFCALSLRIAGGMGFDSERANPNRARFFSDLGIDGERIAARTQTHSKDVFVLEPGWASRGCLPPGDGLAANDASLVLSVTAADCLPIFLADTRSGAVALLHSGWKGTGIVVNALSIMKDRWGTDPEFVSAVLGPCIRACCYEVDAERARIFDADFGGVSSGKPLGSAVKREGQRFFIDMQAANAALLEAAGVENIAVCSDCTYTDDRLGSFRREGSGQFTRMVALLGRLS